MNEGKGIQRFIDAQEPVIKKVVEELRNGKKLSHWMWYIFPQIDGLGTSKNSKFYSIKTVLEAKDFFQNPVLRDRLFSCCNIVYNLENKSAYQIFGSLDDKKFQSSITLFSYVAPEQAIFRQIINKYFSGLPDQKTLQIIDHMKKMSLSK